MPRAEALVDPATHGFAPSLDLAAELLRARLLETTNVELSYKTYRRALARYPDHPVVNLRAAVFAYRRGDFEQALALLRRSWAAAPTPEAWFYLGKIHDDRGESQEALKFLVQVVAFEGEQGFWRTQSLAAIARMTSAIPRTPISEPGAEAGAPPE